MENVENVEIYHIQYDLSLKCLGQAFKVGERFEELWKAEVAPFGDQDRNQLPHWAMCRATSCNQYI